MRALGGGPRARGGRGRTCGGGKQGVWWQKAGAWVPARLPACAAPLPLPRPLPALPDPPPPPSSPQTTPAAHRLYKIALQRHFTRGRRTNQVAAACLYLVCRQDGKPFLLIDFSDALQVGMSVCAAGVGGRCGVGASGGRRMRWLACSASWCVPRAATALSHGHHPLTPHTPTLSHLQINVFTLGAVFLQLAKQLRLETHPMFAK